MNCGLVMCDSNCSRRHLVKITGATALLLVSPALPGFAETQKLRLEGGRLALKRSADGKIIRPGERIVTGAGGAVLRSRDQLFYLDEGTDAEFDADQNGNITAISVVTGGILSLFGPKTGKGTKILSVNASASIRGTTTYFAWQEQQQRTYVCCCYGHLDLANNDGGGTTLETTYHNAVILPSGGGVEPAPYDAPLDHFDDDIATLESHVGRAPRWKLPGGKMNFFADRPAPPLG